MFHLPCPAVYYKNILIKFNSRGLDAEISSAADMENNMQRNGSKEEEEEEEEEEDALQRTARWVRSRKYIINIVLACLAVALEVYYSICGGACSYLKGTIFGIDLQYVGIAYMACIILLSILKKDTILLLLISTGVGVEFYLIGFQVWYNTYCPYCLAFAAIVFILFFLNFKRDTKTLCFISMVVAIILFSIFFNGSLVPSYSYTLHTFSEGFLCG